MKIFRWIIAAALSATAARSSFAQTCLGYASFSSGAARLGANASTSNHIKTYGAEVAAGRPDGLFGSAGIGRGKYDDFDNSATIFALRAGYALNLVGQHLQWCPLATFQYQRGPDIGLSDFVIHSSVRQVALGGSIGGVVMASSPMSIVPFLTAAYTNGKATMSSEDESMSDSQRFLQLEPGAAFVVRQRFTLRPSAILPVGLEDGKPTFRLGASVVFGPTVQH